LQDETRSGSAIAPLSNRPRIDATACGVAPYKTALVLVIEVNSIGSAVRTVIKPLAEVLDRR